MSESKRGPMALNKYQVAERLGIHPVTVYRMVKAGRLPAPTLQTGRIVRWDSEAIEAIVQGGRK